MHSNRPISVVEIYRHSTSNRLNNQKYTRNNGKISQSIAVFSPDFVRHDRIDEDWNGYDTDEKTMEPFNKNLEDGVPMFRSSTINLVRIGIPIGLLLGFIDHEAPCSETLWPIRTGFSSIMNANGSSNHDDEQCHHHKSERKRRWSLPPRLVHVKP